MLGHVIKSNIAHVKYDDIAFIEKGSISCGQAICHRAIGERHIAETNFVIGILKEISPI